MKINDLIALDHPAETTSDPFGLVLSSAHGKRVLNVGAAGNASAYADTSPDLWLHAQLANVASVLVGLDLDADEIASAKALGFDIQCGNCETVNLDQSFDLIVISDVLEHVGNPTTALHNMFRHLEPGGKIVITTPNAAFLGNILKGFLSLPPNVYWDHVQTYLPENIQALCDREEWRLEKTLFFSLSDQRSMKTRIKSAVVRGICTIFPRFHNAFLCFISAPSPRD